MNARSTFESVLRRNLELDGIELDDDLLLADAGLDSLQSVALLVDLEEELGVAIPDHCLTADAFCTVKSLWELVEPFADSE
jgi:acyl carrier protein